MNSQFPRLIKASAYSPSGPSSRPVSQVAVGRGVLARGVIWSIVPQASIGAPLNYMTEYPQVSTSFNQK